MFLSGTFSVRRFSSECDALAFQPNQISTADPYAFGACAIGCVLLSTVSGSNCYYHSCVIAGQDADLAVEDGLVVHSGQTVWWDAGLMIAGIGFGAAVLGRLYLDNDVLFYGGGSGIYGAGGVVHVGTCGFGGGAGTSPEGFAFQLTVEERDSVIQDFPRLTTLKFANSPPARNSYSIEGPDQTAPWPASAISRG